MHEGSGCRLPALVVRPAVYVRQSCPDEISRFDRVLDIVCLGLRRRSADLAQDRPGITIEVEDHVRAGHELLVRQDDNPFSMRSVRLELSRKVVRLILINEAGGPDVADDQVVPVEPVLKTNPII